MRSYLTMFGVATSRFNCPSIVFGDIELSFSYYRVIGFGDNSVFGDD